MSDIGLLVPIIGVTCGLVAIVGRTIVRPWLRLKERQLEMQATMTAEKAAQYAAHTERLEDRVRVLERIATDKGVDLADEIERLRDRPLN